MDKKLLIGITGLAVLALTLGLAAVGTMGSTKAIAQEVKLPCVTPEWVKEHVSDVLGDCLDTGGILFGRPGVKPLGDPIDGGILFARPPTVQPLGDPIDGGILF